MRSVNWRWNKLIDSETTAQRSTPNHAWH